MDENPSQGARPFSQITESDSNPAARLDSPCRFGVAVTERIILAIEAKISRLAVDSTSLNRDLSHSASARLNTIEVSS